MEQKPLVIIMSGFSRSGKTTLAKKIEKEYLPKFARIDSSGIHDYLNRTFPLFLDDNTIGGEGFDLRNTTTGYIREGLIKSFSKAGISLILDSVHTTKEKREKVKEYLKEFYDDFITVIIHIDISEDKLYEYLKEEDRQNIERGEKAAWVDLYESIQKDDYERPTKDEVDYLFRYDGSNEGEILDELNKIVG